MVNLLVMKTIQNYSKNFPYYTTVPAGQAAEAMAHHLQSLIPVLNAWSAGVHCISTGLMALLLEGSWPACRHDSKSGQHNSMTVSATAASEYSAATNQNNVVPSFPVAERLAMAIMSKAGFRLGTTCSAVGARTAAGIRAAAMHLLNLGAEVAILILQIRCFCTVNLKWLLLHSSGNFSANFGVLTLDERLKRQGHIHHTLAFC
jgi:hypothetical protein